MINRLCDPHNPWVMTQEDWQVKHPNNNEIID